VKLFLLNLELVELSKTRPYNTDGQRLFVQQFIPFGTTLLTSEVVCLGFSSTNNPIGGAGSVFDKSFGKTAPYIEFLIFLHNVM
jgi:hypothetical protein